MKTNEYLAIAVGLAAGYFLISWMSKRSAPAARAPVGSRRPNLNMQTLQDSSGQTLPGWGQGTTLDDIWNGKW